MLDVFLNITYPLFFGVIMARFHNEFGELTAYFQRKVIGLIYTDEELKYSKIAFILLGFFFILFGLYNLGRELFLR